MNDNLQVENGGYLRIVNPLFDRLIQVQFKGCELNVAFFIIRKTYGYNKTEDQISISQIMQGVNRSRQTVVTALKNLQLVNIVRLVKRGSSIRSSNVYSVNKYYETWQLVDMARLVKRNRGTSLTGGHKLVKTARHTKDNTKYKTKDNAEAKASVDPINQFIDIFKEINPTYSSLFKMKNQRESAKQLLKLKPLEDWQKIIDFLSKARGSKYCPRISTPVQLEQKYADLETFAVTLKTNNTKAKVAFQ